MSDTYKSQCARDAQRMGYGKKTYWDYLDRHAGELHDKLIELGYTPEYARTMFTRSLAESLEGNDGI